VTKDGKAVDEFYSPDEAFTGKAECDKTAISYTQK